MRAPRRLLAPGFGFLLTALAAPLAYAQSQNLVVRDGTLGSRTLEVGPGVDPLGRPATYLITPAMGEQRDKNLFHSFASFSIGAGEVATFTGPDPIVGPQSISNVISRVTGGDPSQIDGTLRSAIPGANLWLLNPSGVVFGAGAQLDVSGSFHASTADYLGFGADGLERFQADRSLPSVLSTAAPTAFGFLPESGAASLDVNGARLAVPDGETLELVAARDVSLTGAEIVAPGGHVSLEARGAVELSDSLVDVGGDTPGSVSIRAGRVVVEQGSHMLAENTGDAKDAGGSIAVAATESVLVDDSLLSVSTHSAGDAGRIHVESPSFTLQNGPGILDLTHPFRDPSDPRNQPHEVAVGAAAQTFGSGAGGKIEIDAGSLRVIDGTTLAAGSVGSAATGPGGQILISADSVLLEGRAGITVGAWGSQGDGGLVEVHAGTLTLDGTDQFAFIDASIDEHLPPPASYAGAPGTIEITAGTIEILNGGTIYNACFQCTSQLDDRPPDAGLTRIQANHMIVDGSNGYNQSYVIAQNQGTEGDAARIEIRVEGALELTNGGSIFDGVGPGASGSGGSITIDAGSLTVSSGAQITAGAVRDSSGDAGSITIEADSLRVESGGYITVATAGAGDAGTVTIEARSVRVEGGSIVANTSGEGNGGSVTIRAESVRVGPGGSSFINVTSARPSNASSDFVPGNSGAIDIVASDSIFLTHEGGDRFSLVGVLTGRSGLSGLLSATVSGGAGGSIKLAAPEITITDGAIVATTTVGGGAGGSVELRGDRISIANGGVVDTTSLLNPFTGNPGGDAGSVTLEASDRIEVKGRSKWGDVSRVSSGSIGSGEAGEVALRAPRILIDEGLVASMAVAFANGREGSAGGSVTIRADELVVANGGQLNASTFIAGPAGSIDVVAQESILVTGEGSGIESRTGGAGAGGDVTLSAPRIEINDGGEVSANSERGFHGALGNYLASTGQGGLIRLPPEGALPTGNAGVVSLDASNEVRVDRGTIATNAEAADGGNVTIRANHLLYLDRSLITASVTGGSGGNITIDPDFVILQNGSRIEASAGTGAGGQIQITTDSFFAFPGSVVSATAGDPELSGTVEIHSPDVNLAGTLSALPSSLLDAASLMHERCAARRTGERAGSFAMRGPGGIPAEPDGWLRAPMLAEVAATAAGAPGRPALVASLPGALLVDAACP